MSGSEKPARPSQRSNQSDHFANLVNQSGEIYFTNSRVAKYVRLDPNVSVEATLKFLLWHWRLPIPSLCIQITGGARDFLGPEDRRAFGRSLLQVAQKTSAWVVTGGTHCGVMRYVGQALAGKYTAEGQIPSIGIASWGVLAGRGYIQSGLTYDPYALSKRGQMVEKGVPLDPNHTHFLLCDDGSEGTFGVELNFVSRLLAGLSHTELSSGVAVPVIMFLLEGGPNSLSLALDALESGLPCIVGKGTGRAASLLEEAQRTWAEVSREVWHAQTMKAVKECFGEANLENFVHCIEQNF